MKDEKLENIRIYVRHRTLGRYVMGLFKREGGKHPDFPMEIYTSHEISGRIPRNKDIYVLHCEDISERDLDSLREKQPWSFMIGISWAGNMPSQIDWSTDIRSYFDCFYTSGREVESDFERLFRTLLVKYEHINQRSKSKK